MEKSAPPPYYGPPSAPNTDYPQGGYPPHQGGYPQSGYPQQGGYPHQEGYPPPGGYPSYPPPSGYQPQSGYPIHSGYTVQSGSGYPPPGYQPKPEYQQPPPAHPVNWAPQPPYVPRNYGWCEDSQRNKPQSNSLAAATFIFTSGGMSLAWSVGFAPTYKYLSKAALTHMQICWFVAVIIGACLATILIEKLTKRIFNILASILVIINGILFVSDPESIAAIVIARYCDGIAFGLTLIPAIVAGSEQSVKRFRGLVLSVEQIGLVTGIMLKTIYMNVWGNSYEVNSNQIHGILALIYGAIAFIFTFIFTIETPIFYLRKENEAEAINVLRRLQRPQTVTNETYALLYENKHLLEEDRARGQAVNVSTGIMPMVKLCLFRAFVSMSFSVPLVWAFIVSSIVSVGSSDPWSLYLFAVMRMLGIMFSLFTLDTIGRKGLTAFALLIGGGLMIGVGSVFSNIWDSGYMRKGNMDAVMGLLLAYQVFAGVAAPTSTCYLGEAFSISVKPYFILVVVIMENIVQIIICCSFKASLESITDYGFALGALQIAFALFFFLVMPETKNTTLREALTLFKKALPSRNG